MKKIKLFHFFIFAILIASNAFADIDITSMVGSSTGVTNSFSEDKKFEIPFSAFYASQINIGNWGILRGNLEIKTRNIAGGNLLIAQDAKLKLNELSLVLKAPVGNRYNYFGFFAGTYEVIGRDEFIQRQFSVDPITSILTTDKTTLESGIPLYDNSGEGFSFTTNFAPLPGAFSINFYLTKTSDSIIQPNLDLRTAWVWKFATIDFSIGIGAPIQNQYKDDTVFILIDSLYFHSGISVLLGNNYTHSLFFQAGIQNIKITPSSTFERTFNNLNDITLLIEPRIYSRIIKASFTLYDIPKSRIEERLYLRDQTGFAFSIYSDNINTRRSQLTLGLHTICSVKDNSLFSLIENISNESNIVLNMFITPFAKLPIGDGYFEAMAQVGLLDFTKATSVDFNFILGYKRHF